MGLKRFQIAVLMLVVAAFAARGIAAPFVNLDFEQAVVPPGTPSSTNYPAALAFPGWTAQLNGVPLSSVYFDDSGIGDATVALFDKPAQNLGIALLQGAYDAILVGDVSLTLRASLSQSGDIPANARSLRLLCDGFRGPPAVAINGVNITMVHISGGSFIGDTALYGGDITPFAGLTSAQLNFMSTVPPHGVISGFDAVSLSSVPIPESRWSLLALGLPLLRALRRR